MKEEQDSVMKNRQEITKPWGSFSRYTLNEPSTVKTIIVRAGESSSLQSHKNRHEFWKVLRGSGIFFIDGKEHPAKIGDEFFISAGTTHRLAAANEEVEILEISFGHFDEEDIKRLEDKYGRAEK